MTQTTRLGLGLLSAAALIGLLGDALLRGTPWGINVVLWVGALLGILGLLARRLDWHGAGEGKWLAVPALLLAAGLAWRDSGTLRALDITGLLCCLGVGAARTRTGQIHLAGFVEYIVEMVRSLFQILFGVFPLLFGDIAWDTVPRSGWLPRVLAVGRGLLLVLPLLLLFGGLLTAADAVYQKLVSQVFHFDLSVLLGHFFLTLLLAWLAAGFGRMLFLVERVPKEAGQPSKRLVLGTLETATILGLLNLLFLSFVLVQIRYFFGGAATVASTAGLTYTQYARSGFFELVWVAALVLPCLLGLHERQTPGDTRAQRLFSAQAAVQVALLSVILASAMLRMRLYQQACGMTELRLYTMAFMVWLAVVFVWFVATVLVGQRPRFAFGAAVLALGLVVVLHVLNPDALIVRVNASHASVQPFDVDYAASLSADAVPSLVAVLPSLPPSAQTEAAAKLLPVWSTDPNDWRSWNWGRMTAFHAVQSHQAPLQAAMPPAKTGNCGCQATQEQTDEHNLRQTNTRLAPTGSGLRQN